MSDNHPPSHSDHLLLIASAAHRGDAATVLGELASSDPERRVLAIGAALRLDLLDPSTLLRLLRDPHPSVRRRAAEAAGRIAPPEPAVLSELVALGDPEAGSDDDHPVQEVCYFALGELEIADAAVVDLLSRAARRHPDHLCREAAVAALGALGKGRDVLLAALDDRATVRRRAVLGLVNFEGPDIDTALNRALEDRDWQVRQAAEDLLRPDDQ